MDNPFTSKEHRFVLAEMIKTSSVDVYQLENFVKSHGIVPDWLNMQLPRGRNMNECMLATKQLSAPYHGRDRNSSGSSHGDYSSISQAMRSPPTLQPSIHPPQPPSYQGSSSILPRPMPNGNMPGATTTTAVMTVPTGGSPRAKSAQGTTTADMSKPPPKKRGRPSRADRAKRELRPLLPQHLMPRPPPMDHHPQQQQQQPPQQHQNIYQSGLYYSPPPLPSALAMQDANRPTITHRLSPEPGRSIKKRRRGSTPDRLPPVGDIIGTPKSREED